jgi:hypothetical protein
MKTLSRMMSVCAVMVAGGASLAADCCCQNSSPGVATASPRVVYRSGYAYSGQAATPTFTPVRSTMSGGRYYSTSESNWDFVRARQHVRGW